MLNGKLENLLTTLNQEMQISLTAEVGEKDCSDLLALMPECFCPLAHAGLNGAVLGVVMQTGGKLLQEHR